MPYRICWYCFHFATLDRFRFEKGVGVWLCKDIQDCVERGKEPKVARRRNERLNRMRKKKD